MLVYEEVNNVEVPCIAKFDNKVDVHSYYGGEHSTKNSAFLLQPQHNTSAERPMDQYIVNLKDI